MGIRSGLITISILLLPYVLGPALGGISLFGLSHQAEIAFVILVVAATLWITEAVPLFVTSLLVLFYAQTWLAPAMKASGIAVEKSTFLAPFFSDVILLFLGGFVISAALHTYQIDERLARWILKRTGGSISMLSLGIMGMTAFLSMWLSNTATAAMMMALVLPIADKLQAGDSNRKLLILSVPFAANIGGLGTPLGSPPNAIAMTFMRKVDLAPSFLQWIMIGVPGVVSMLLIAWLLLTFLYGRKCDALDTQSRHITSVPWDWKPKFIVGITTLTAIMWMTTQLHGLTSGTVALIPVIILFGMRILRPEVLRTLAWDVLLLMGGGLCLGTCVSESGLADWIVDQLSLESASSFQIMIVFAVVACVMSSVMSNTATATLILPIAIGLDVTPLTPILIGIAFGCSLAMPLPISTPPNAMAFSSGQISVKEMLIPGLILTAGGLMLACTVGYTWWKFIGLF